MIKVPPMKKQKQAGEDEESDDREEEAEGSGSISMLIFQPGCTRCVHKGWLCMAELPQTTQGPNANIPPLCGKCKGSKLCCTARDGGHTIVVATGGKTIWRCTLVTQSQPPTPAMDPATPAGMEKEGKEDPIALNPTPSPPHKKAHCVQVRSPSPLTLAPGPVPSASTSTSHLAPAGGSTSTTALAAPPSFIHPRQPGEGNCAYVLVDTFQQVLVQEHMTQLEHEMAEMTRNMCCWWDNIVADYLELNQHVKTMEDNQCKFIQQ
ncbi:hypothetical protein ID866_11678 [Astraeus odoratus]|nr:hypothetical protein ID866_11678 [Astraeus odoratus]